jgi:hypothetical protein
MIIGCYARLSRQVGYKNVIFVFLKLCSKKCCFSSRRGQHIGRKENFSGGQSLVRDVMREGKHFVPGGTEGERMVFFYRYNIPGGTKKNEYLKYFSYPPIRG